MFAIELSERKRKKHAAVSWHHISNILNVLGPLKDDLRLVGGSPVILKTQVASDNLADLRRNAVAIVNGAA